jgi:hypothetical protein
MAERGPRPRNSVARSDYRLVAVREDGTRLRPESHSDEFQRLRSRAGLRRIKLHGLRNTSVSLMLDEGHPPHIVAGWHGHDPAVALSIYSDPAWDTGQSSGTRHGPPSARNMPLTCKDFGGRDRYRTCDRWCVKPELYH